MKAYRRYAIYYTPPAGWLADFGAHWLGWDPVAGQPVAQPEIPGLDLPEITAAPRKYGFHATLKAPFRLADGVTQPMLRDAAAALAMDLSPPVLSGLRLARIGSFLGLIADGNSFPADSLADEVVTRLDPLRAPLTKAEIARRKPDLLTSRQRNYLNRFGYPYIREEFRLHMTLSGALNPVLLDAVEAALRPRLTDLPRPFVIDAITLMGEADDGSFHLLERLPLRAETQPAIGG